VYAPATYAHLASDRAACESACIVILGNENCRSGASTVKVGVSNVLLIKPVPCPLLTIIPNLHVPETLGVASKVNSAVSEL
jgi:hypothetical protein